MKNQQEFCLSESQMKQVVGGVEGKTTTKKPNYTTPDWSTYTYTTSKYPDVPADDFPTCTFTGIPTYTPKKK